MSPAEYEQLVEFLGTRFAEIDRRLSTAGSLRSTADSTTSTSRFDAVDAPFDDLRRDMRDHLERLGH
jgi:hypothetical protein